jgi:hypothetical protein
MRMTLVRALLLLAVGCGQGSSTDTTSKPAGASTVSCDPLAPTVLPIVGGRIAGVGKDPAGTLYLVDEVERVGLRLFVSQGMSLPRRRVWGTAGEGSGPGARVLVSSEDEAGELNLQIEVGDAGPTKMGLLRGRIPSSKFFTVGVDGVELQVLPSKVPDGYHLENLPGTFGVSYLGSVADGRVVLVTSPSVDTRYEDFRLFFGPADRLIERPLVRVAVGSYSTLVFTVDGREAIAVFGSPLNTFVTSMLTIDGDSQPLTVSDARTPPPGASFFCLH